MSRRLVPASAQHWPMSGPRRDSRIDFLRGLALLGIAANHIRGNWVTEWTPVAWGFSDMAEVFAFLSGLVTFQSLKRASASQTPGQVIRKVFWRLTLIYLAYVVSGTLLVLLARFLGTGLFHGEISDQLLLCDPVEVPLLVASLRFRVSHLTILPLYLALNVLAGLLWSHSPPRVHQVLGVSLAVYALTQLAPDIICYPSPHKEQLYYNPFAWQFLFIAGGSWTLLDERIRSRIRQSRLLPLTGLAILCLLHGLCFQGNPAWLASSKETLGWSRLLHFLAAAVMIAPLMTRFQDQLTRGPLAKITCCGRHSLLVYCCGAILSAIGTYERVAAGADPSTDALVTATLLALCISLAVAAETFVFTRPRVSSHGHHQ